MDTGDYFFRDISLMGLEAHQLKRKAEILAFAAKELGYDVVTPGESDLATGLGGYRELVKAAAVTPISANLMLGGKRVFEPFAIREVNGVKIGFIGVMHTLRPLPQENNQPLVLADPTASVKEAVASLQGKVDLVIALTHLGFDVDRELANKVPGIDIILGGHSRESLGIGSVYGKTAIFQAGMQGKYVGQVKLRKTVVDGKVKVERTGGELHEMGPNRPEDVKFTKVVKEYHDWVEEENKKKRVPAEGSMATTSADDIYWGAELCGQCHAKQDQFWKTTKHAHAYETLVKAGKQHDVECLACHTTAFAQTRSRPGLKGLTDVTGLESVQCENCHAPGSKHNAPEIRTRTAAKETCTRCHDPKNSPKFLFDEWRPKVRCPAGS